VRGAGGGTAGGGGELKGAGAATALDMSAASVTATVTPTRQPPPSRSCWRWSMGDVRLPDGLRVLGAARSEAPSRSQRCGGAHSEGSAGSQVVQIWQMDAGQCVEKVGLGGTEVRESLGACAQVAASGHMIIVRAGLSVSGAVRTCAPLSPFPWQKRPPVYRSVQVTCAVSAGQRCEGQRDGGCVNSKRLFGVAEREPP
jgi:hypothetical protein